MMILTIFLILVICALSVALYFQMKAARESAEDGQQLLTDYQKRVDELEKLLKDYRDLQENFDNVGQGYEQALLAFDKMEEEKNTIERVKSSLEKQSSDLLAQKGQLEQTVLRKKELVAKALGDLRQRLDLSQPEAVQIARLANNIANINEVELETAIETDDNCLASDITRQAIRETGIDRADYISFRSAISPEAEATLLFTNQTEATHALVNLLDNALKFTTSGAVTLYTNVSEAGVEYIVEDSGTGVAADDAEKIFQPFTKLNSYFEGAGCGLTVARSIARRLGGDVRLDTDYSRGARFIFKLPI